MWMEQDIFDPLSPLGQGAYMNKNNYKGPPRVVESGRVVSTPSSLTTSGLGFESLGYAVVYDME
ncbi:hypothetical protein H5410_015530 [Solanum commersonii]|uniref:Uncharacterized protein n=1 Tax=Solanum commersonii TaxID=4109 RepID=A0A9J5ZUN6_SOLCO|nr:hypothetical protein H5410_015530 [Solanum commersonii]